MSETTWGESDAALPPPKKRFPTWLWFCGGGCLLATILGIVAIGWFASKFKEAVDPEKQWPALATVLPYDERPPELELRFGAARSFAMKMEHVFVLEDKRGFLAILMQFGADDAAKVRDQFLNPKFDGSFMGFGGRKGLADGTVNVQGRDLHVLRFFQQAKAKGEDESSSKGEGDENSSFPGGPRGSGKGPAAIIDLTPPGDARPLVLQMIHMQSEEPVSDDAIRAFLKTFHVGQDR